jgi:hypothetical protein
MVHSSRVDGLGLVGAFLPNASKLRACPAHHLNCLRAKLQAGFQAFGLNTGAAHRFSRELEHLPDRL